jgi:hypothetical protein
LDTIFALYVDSAELVLAAHGVMVPGAPPADVLMDQIESLLPQVESLLLQTEPFVLWVVDAGD